MREPDLEFINLAVGIGAKFLREVVRVADANEASMGVTATTGPVRKVIDGADVVVCVWQEPEQPHGVGWMVVKGLQRLRDDVERMIDSDLRYMVHLKHTAIKCAGAEQAEAASRLFGDMDRLQ